MEPKIINLEKCDWETMREKVQMKCFQGEYMTVQFAQIYEGHSISPHRHEYEQIAMILQGECDFFVDGVAYPLQAGSIVDIPPNAEHYIVVKGPTPVINVDLFYPKRPDRKESVEVR